MVPPVDLVSGLYTSVEPGPLLFCQQHTNGGHFQRLAYQLISFAWKTAADKTVI